MKPIRIAVVGAGHLGRIHTRILSSHEGFSLVGIADPVEAQRSAVAAEFKTTAFAHHAELLSQVDAVVIAAPTVLHRRLAGEFIAACKHVFVEKPITSTSQEAAELVQLARREHVALQVGHVERFNPAFHAALPHLHEPKYIESVRRGGFTFRSTDIGVVLDLMIHDLDLVLSIARSPVARVEAMGVAIFGKHEDVANARIEFENGCVATLNACRASHSAARTMQVWTPRGFTSIDFNARTANVVCPSDTLRNRSIDIERLNVAEKQQLRDCLMTDHLPLKSIEVAAGDAITAELTDFAESIRTGRSPRVNGQAGYDAVAVAERVLDSIAQHAWDGKADGRVGPFFAPGSPTIPAPHWQLKPARQDELRRAG